MRPHTCPAGAPVPPHRRRYRLPAVPQGHTDPGHWQRGVHPLRCGLLQWCARHGMRPLTSGHVRQHHRSLLPHPLVSDPCSSRAAQRSAQPGKCNCTAACIPKPPCACSVPIRVHFTDIVAHLTAWLSLPPGNCSPKGTWNNEAAQDNCNSCPPGKYSNTLGAKECKTCAGGTFSAGQASACTDCRPGYAAPAGSAACSPW